MNEDEDEHVAEEIADQRLAAKINRLFEVVHPTDRGAYKPHEVVTWLEETSGPDRPTISLNHLLALKRGQRTNPTLNALRAIARFFQVEVAYLVSDDEQSRKVDEQLAQLALFRDRLVEGIATRAASMDRPRRKWVLEMLEAMPDPPSATEPRRSDEDTDGDR